MMYQNPHFGIGPEENRSLSRLGFNAGGAVRSCSRRTRRTSNSGDVAGAIAATATSPASPGAELAAVTATGSGATAGSA
jgi:hypothetical protein